MQLIDFSHCQESLRSYPGGSMQKRLIIYNNEHYMLKLQTKGIAPFYRFWFRNLDTSGTYFNSVFSEYIASQIASSIGLDVLSTLLGYYQDSPDQKKVNVVACKNFLNKNEELKTMKTIFSELKLSDEERKKRGIDDHTLNGTLNLIKHQKVFDPKLLLDFFWEMIVFDGYIGNFDRNPNNWGIIVNIETGSRRIAPIFEKLSMLVVYILKHQEHLLIFI